MIAPCGKHPLSLAIICEDCQAKGIEAFLYSTRRSGNEAVTTFRRLSPGAKEHYSTGDAAATGFLAFCIDALHGSGLMERSVAVRLLEKLGTVPPSEPLPWEGS